MLGRCSFRRANLILHSIPVHGSLLCQGYVLETQLRLYIPWPWLWAWPWAWPYAKTLSPLSFCSRLQPLRAVLTSLGYLYEDANSRYKKMTFALMFSQTLLLELYYLTSKLAELVFSITSSYESLHTIGTDSQSRPCHQKRLRSAVYQDRKFILS